MKLKIFSLVILLVLSVSNLHATVSTKPFITQNNFPLSQDYEVVAFHNDCYKPVEFVVHYLDLDENWITDGYYQLNPDEEGNVFLTRNTIFYFYAHTFDDEIIWDGDYNIPFKGIVYPMIKQKMSISDWGTYTLNLTCN